VSEVSAVSPARGIRNLHSSPSYRDKLAARALEVFRASHDLESQQRKFYLTLGQIARDR